MEDKKKKNPYNLSEIDRKIGVEMRECIKCNMLFHVLRTQEYKKCAFCLMGEKRVINEEKKTDRKNRR